MPVTESQVAGTSESFNSDRGSFLYKAVGKCPEAIVHIGPVEMRCLLDSGSQVSTITESFFEKKLMGKGVIKDVFLVRSFLDWDSLLLKTLLILLLNTGNEWFLVLLVATF